jgi:Glycosyltransferase
VNILYIAPFPPPLTGQSLANKVLFKELNKFHNVDIIDLSNNNLKQEEKSFQRIYQTFLLLIKVFKKKKKVDVIYFNLSQSILGNFKDLLIYLLCHNKLSRMVVHLHGGGLKQIIFDKNKLQYSLNKYFLRRINAVIVLGKSLINIFSEFLPNKKLYVVYNFSENQYFLSTKKINNKFKKVKNLKILFLSNLLEGKGHNQLVDAYQLLDYGIKEKVLIDFAGNFESIEKNNKFLKKIDRYKNINYHGVVHGSKKKNLLSNAHIFCLPTYYH